MEKEKEIKTVELMIKLYCRKKHNTKNGKLCHECQNLFDYVVYRRSKCPFGEDKPFCSNCTIHCYNKEMRQKIREVMKYSGPRMIFIHPFIVTSHLMQTLRQKHNAKKIV